MYFWLLVYYVMLLGRCWFMVLSFCVWVLFVELFVFGLGLRWVVWVFLLMTDCFEVVVLAGFVVI